MYQYIPCEAVTITDAGWRKQFRLLADVTIPFQWEILNDRIPGAAKSHCVENFRVAAGTSKDQHYGTVFLDSDLYKWLEAAAYRLTIEKDETLENICDGAIDLIASAQMPDGYLSTWYQTAQKGLRWTNLMEGHEMYCAGHLFEAAAAYHRATKKEKLLNVARRLADHIASVFGPGKRRGYPGHPEIELGLIRLANETGNKAYTELARYFINERGQSPSVFDEQRRSPEYHPIFPEVQNFSAEYFQNHLPVRRQQTAAGHAVRAMYLYAAMADIAHMSGEKELTDACMRLYSDTVERQMHVTGGIGSAAMGERFTVDYDLPPDSVYAESCASVGLMQLSRRMWLLSGNPACFDVWERALQNTVLSGMGLDGRHFFYVNPLETVPRIIHSSPSYSHVEPRRPEWFGVACCPPNIARCVLSLGGSVFAKDEDTLCVLTPLCASFSENGLSAALEKNDNELVLSLDGKEMELKIRVPDGFACTAGPSLRAEGRWLRARHPGGKAQYRFTLQPLIRVLHADCRVPYLNGRVCVQRGSEVYCAEEIDNGGDLAALRIPENGVFEEVPSPLGNDSPALTVMGSRVQPDASGRLYSDAPEKSVSCLITLVPYRDWGNRGGRNGAPEGEMRVWLCEK